MTGRIALLAVALIASAPAAAQERELSTDRPDKTESPYTVPAGRIQIELDFATFTHDEEAGVRARTVDIAPFNLKFGVAPDTDVQIVVDSYFRETVEDRVFGARAVRDGFGDVTVRLKHNLWGNEGGKTAFALMPFVKLPTNSGGVGNARVEGGVIAPLAVDLGAGLGLGLMTEMDIVRKSDDGSYTASFINSATLAFDLSERLGLYTEIFTEQSAERGARFVATFDTGMTYAFGENTQFDLGANIGVSDAADDLALFLGLSRRF